MFHLFQIFEIKRGEFKQKSHTKIKAVREFQYLV
jgi:hypothetical protein